MLAKGPLLSEAAVEVLENTLAKPRETCLLVCGQRNECAPVDLLVTIAARSQQRFPEAPAFAFLSSGEQAATVARDYRQLADRQAHLSGFPIKFMPPSASSLTHVCRTSNGTAPLIIIDETGGAHPGMDILLGLARHFLPTAGMRLVILCGNHREGPLASWWPEAHVSHLSNNEPSRPPAATFPGLSRAARLSKCEMALTYLLQAGAEPSSNSLPTVMPPAEMERALEGLEMIGVVKNGELTVPAGRFATRQIAPRTGVMATKAGELPHPQRVLSALALLDFPPVRSKNGWFVDPPPYNGRGPRSDLAFAASAFAAHSAEKDDGYVRGRIFQMERIADIARADFSGRFDRQGVDKEKLAVVALSGLIDHLLVETGEPRTYRSVFFPEQDAIRKLFKNSQCEGAAMIVGVPFDPPSPQQSPADSRVVLATEVTLKTVDDAFPGSVRVPGDIVSPTAAPATRMAAISIEGRRALLFFRDTPHGRQFTTDHIVEAPNLLYITGMIFALTRASAGGPVVARTAEETFDASAVATIRTANGPILRSQHPVSFAMGTLAPLVATTWEDLGRQIARFSRGPI